MSEQVDARQLEEKLIADCRVATLEEITGEQMESFVREHAFSDAARRVAERWSAHLRIKWLASYLKRPGKRESELLALCYPNCDTESGRLEFARNEIKRLWREAQ